MEQAHNRPQISLKKPPYFRKGCLVFLDSNHTLHLSGKYYRCTKDSHGACDIHKTRVLQKTLETAFSRYAEKYTLRHEYGVRYFKKLLKDNLFDLVDENELDMDKIDEQQLLTIEAAEEDLKRNNRVSNIDLHDLRELEQQKRKYETPIFLFAYAFGMLKVLTNPNNKSDIGRSLAQITRHIYITDKGKIASIEFQPWGWYILNGIMEGMEPGFSSRLRKNTVEILNPDDPDLRHMKIPEAANAYSGLHRPIGETYHTSLAVTDLLVTAVEMLLGSADSRGEVIVEMHKRLQTDPIFASLVRVSDSTSFKRRG